MIRIFSQYVSPKSLLLVMVESVLMGLALLCAVWLRFWHSPLEIPSYTQLPEFGWQAVLFVVVFQVCFSYGDMYNLTAIRRHNEQWILLGQSLGAGCLLLGLLYFLFPGLLIGRGVFFLSTILMALFISLSRLALDTVWRLAAPKQNVVILGTEGLAATVARELAHRPDLSLKLIGYVDPTNGADATPIANSPRSAKRHAPDCLVAESVRTIVLAEPEVDTTYNELVGYPVLGGAAHLEQLASSHQLSRIIIAMEDRRGRLPVQQLVKLRVQGVRVEDAQSTLASLTGRVWLRTVHPSWFVFSDGFHRSRLTLIVKRAIDLSFGLLGLIVSLPIMLLVMLAIKLDSKGPVIYRQVRVGLRDKHFAVLKFRSMRLDAEKESGAQWAQKNDPRVTRIGNILRKFRLDELPQFINVIRGEMSFVGPRPERPVFVQQLRKEISYYDERHTVRPGLTGWAQVQYRYGASVEDAFRKLEYDLFYLKNMSLFFDAAIILKTIRIVLAGQGSR